MPTIVTATASSTATPADLFARWVDHATWSEWSPDTEWVRLDGPVTQGTTGTLKPNGGPKVRFRISQLTPDRSYVDVSRFPGGRLTFAHHARPSATGTDLEVVVRIDGPLAFLWARILGKGFRASAPADLQRLVRLVESARV